MSTVAPVFDAHLHHALRQILFINYTIVHWLFQLIVVPNFRVTI